MADDFLNCGNAYLEAAAQNWAKKHDYTVRTFRTESSFGTSFGTRWGSGR